jgi:fructokinase
MSDAMPVATPIVFGEALVDAFGDVLKPGGAPFNVACHLAALGLRPLMITRVGNDEAGHLLRDTAARFGLSLQASQLAPRSARVEVSEGDGGHVFVIPADQAFDDIDSRAAVQAAAAEPDPCWLYFGSLALRQPTSRSALAALRASRTCRTFVDLNWREAGPTPEVILEVLHDIEVLKVSDTELGQLLGWLGLPSASAAPVAGERRPALAALCHHLGARYILVSHGAAGAAAWDAGGCCIARALSPPVPLLRDTVGAGDAFSAWMFAGLLMGLPVPGTLDQAVAFASLSCGWRGALPEASDFYHPWRIRLGIDAPTSPPNSLAR